MSTVIQSLDKAVRPEQPLACSENNVLVVHQFIHSFNLFLGRWA